jgi:hypothetical protein
MIYPRYENDAQELKNEIKRLIIKHPRILEFNDPWRLLDIDDFKPVQRRLSPSLAQVSAALRLACVEIEMEERGQIKVDGEYIKTPRFKHPREVRRAEEVERRQQFHALMNSARWIKTI